jgi:apolipoprotein N-acyltransferase
MVDPVLQSVADRTGATLVIGVLHVVAQDSFNEARIYTPDLPIATYDKQHMLPPFESKLKPGTSLALLSTPAVPIGVAICKDMDFIHPALDYGRGGVDLLLDPAWDFNVDRTWHGHTAIMRGVEGGYRRVPPVGTHRPWRHEGDRSSPAPISKVEPSSIAGLDYRG